MSHKLLRRQSVNFVIHIYRLEDRAKRVTYIPGHSIKKPGYTAWREQFVYIANPGKSGLGRSVSQTKLMNQCRHLFGVFLVAYFQKACRYSVRFLILVGKPRTKSIDESWWSHSELLITSIAATATRKRLRTESALSRNIRLAAVYYIIGCG